MNAWPMYARCAWRQWSSLPRDTRVEIVNAMRVSDLESVVSTLRELRERDIDAVMLEDYFRERGVVLDASNRIAFMERELVKLTKRGEQYENRH